MRPSVPEDESSDNEDGLQHGKERGRGSLLPVGWEDGQRIGSSLVTCQAFLGH